MLELNRMAFDSFLPKNSESRSIAIAIKLLKKNAPHIKWILSFSDATQCGDGVIYRASGFHLTGIKKNTEMFVTDEGVRFSGVGLRSGANNLNKQVGFIAGQETFNNFIKRKSITPLVGFQLRYIYIIDKSCHLNTNDLPFSEIDKLNAGMYRGEKISVKERKIKSVVNIDNDVVTNPSYKGGAVPTTTHH